MSGFDPGPGWREVERPDAAMHGEVVSYRAPRGDEPRVRTWVRDEPVPPLPTAPYTVIRVTESCDPDLIGQVLTGNGVGSWSNSGHTLGPASTARRITGFEVLAEPRAVTAKAVIAEAKDYFDGAWIPGHERLFSYDHQRALFERLRSKFGASS